MKKNFKMPKKTQKDAKLTSDNFDNNLFQLAFLLKYIIYNSTIEILFTPAFLALSINFTTYS